jgi:type I restriction enzyme, R subunit
MMARYKTEDEYNRQIIDAFKGSGDPEILIVVSKLLTGFDAPRNTVLYVCKSLREHNLLQAIARVNRLYEDGDDREAVRLHHRL